MLSFACVALEFSFGQEYPATWSSSEGVVVGECRKSSDLGMVQESTTRQDWVESRETANSGRRDGSRKSMAVTSRTVLGKEKVNENWFRQSARNMHIVGMSSRASRQGSAPPKPGDDDG
jgi:hypothetical protein